uniref:Putative ovule protein n=1 Tax=Solanum chacoense TaxID=4108 RepID=A0A0V0H4N8_SOLCH
MGQRDTWIFYPFCQHDMVVQSSTTIMGKWAKAPGWMICLTKGVPCQLLPSWHSNLVPSSRVFLLDIEYISPKYSQY